MGAHTQRVGWWIPVVLATVLSVSSATAAAQDYSLSTPTGQLIEPPTQTTEILTSTGGFEQVDLPFRFPFYGTEYDSVWVANNGFLQFGVETATGGNGFSTVMPKTTDFNGLCAPFWSFLQRGAIHVWTQGDAPNRVTIVHWQEMRHSQLGTGKATFQAQLHEGTGKIVFAYAPLVSAGDWSPFASGGTWGYSFIAIDAPRDSDTRSSTIVFNPTGGHPSTDYVLTPRSTTFSGSVTVDEVEATPGGAGAQIRSGVIPEGLQVALCWTDGVIAARASVAADGSFSVVGRALTTGASGSLKLLAENDACVVRASAGGPSSSIVVVDSVSFTSGQDVGASNVGASQDPSGSARSALHVARRILAARDWLADRNPTTIPRLEVLHDPQSTEPTAYAEAADIADASLRVAGIGAANPDGWDQDVVVRTYGRHVLAALAARTGKPAVDAFDAATDEQNAFAVGFGHYLAAALSGSGSFIDTTGPSTANVIDVESATVTAPAGPSVAGRVAGFLHDLEDPADEDDDRTDGTSGPDRVLAAVDAEVVALTVDRFAVKWRTLGLGDDLAFSRSQIHHGLVADDGDEPNDDMAERAAFGVQGVRRQGLVLNVLNDDWYEVEVDRPGNALHAGVGFDGASQPAHVMVQILSAAGSVLATATDSGGAGGATARSGPVQPGTYLISVQHLGGPRISSYSLQVHLPLSVSATPLPPWTAGRPYAASIPVDGGIPPYSLEVQPPTAFPQGLGVSIATQSVFGTPGVAGRYQFNFLVSDSGVPLNQGLVAHTLVINEALDLALPPFVGLPSGRPLDSTRMHQGGTTPLVVALGTGELPPGVQLDASAIRFTGQADATGSADVRIDAVDVAGSADSGTTRVVVCAPLVGKGQPVDLASGDAACGFFVDALAGSQVKLNAATAKKRARRVLSPAVLEPSGLIHATAKTKGGSGKASASFTCTQTGRHFFILDSSSGEETQLLGTVVLQAPKSLKAKKIPLGVNVTVPIEFGALAGAEVTLKAKVDKKSGVAYRVLAVLDPEGNSVAASSYEAVVSGPNLTLTTTVATSGTWTILLRGSEGADGLLAWSLKLKQPKGVVFSAD